MSLSLKEVRHIAALARLDLPPEEEEAMRQRLSSILDYVSQLQECEVEGVEPMPQATPLVNVWREDEVLDCGPEVRQRILDGFPDREGDLLRVKAVFSGKG